MASHTAHHTFVTPYFEAEEHRSFVADPEPLDPQGYGAALRATLQQFRNDRDDLWAGLGMDDELVASVRYNPIENYVELPICRADAREESIRAFMLYFWAHAADADMNRIHFYYAR